MTAARKFDQLISSDSHVTEPSDLWENAIGSGFGERTPRMVGEREGRAGMYFDVGGGLLVVMEKIIAGLGKTGPVPAMPALTRQFGCSSSKMPVSMLKSSTRQRWAASCSRPISKSVTLRPRSTTTTWQNIVPLIQTG